MFVRTLTLVMLMALGAAANGYACSLAPGVPAPTREEQFSSASAVFVGHLTQAVEIQDLIVEGTFHLAEVLKGTPPADNKVRSLILGAGNCTIPFLVGTDYVFFTYDSSAFITMTDGSAPLPKLDTAAAEEVLSRLRALQK